MCSDTASASADTRAGESSNDGRLLTWLPLPSSSVLPSRRNGRDASLKKVGPSTPRKHLLDCYACADDPSISSQNGFLGWGDLSGQHLSHSFEDELFEPLDDDHIAAEDQPKKAKGASEDSKVDALWLRLVDRSLEMVRIRPPSTLAPPSPKCSTQPADPLPVSPLRSCRPPR